MITIVDYGMGNIASILNMFKYIGVKDVALSNDPELISKADKLILPGVGAFDNGMQKLNDQGLTKLLDRLVLEEKRPILGICLGMQLLTSSSEEGQLPGLSWIEAETIKFKFDDPNMKVPHMGWNYIDVARENLILDMESRQRFYFVHSYFVRAKNRDEVLATCNYGFEFDCALHKDNIWGMQFHPEKSHKFGMEVFKSFAAL